MPLRPAESATARGGRPRPAAAPPPRIEETAEITLAFDDNRRASLLFGHYDQNLAHIERRLGIVANALATASCLKGSPEAADTARRVLEGPLRTRSRRRRSHARRRRRGDPGKRLPGHLVSRPRRVPPLRLRPDFYRKRGPVRARNAAQDAYIKALRQRELVFAEGPAGTGKTWLAVGHAVSLLEQGQADR
jgi:phosphate starvation-inducible PhoH-like protein